MKSPRRIFRSSLSARTGRAGQRLSAWLLGAVVIAGLITVGLSSDLFGQGQPLPDRLLAEPEKVAVVDGDTLRLDGRIVRLAGITAPGRGDICRGGTDCGGAATSALAGLVRDRRVECRLRGQDGMGRPYGACDANGTDLSRAIVAAGWARAQPATPGLADLELRARLQGAGLWASETRQH